MVEREMCSIGTVKGSDSFVDPTCGTEETIVGSAKIHLVTLEDKVKSPIL